MAVQADRGLMMVRVVREVEVEAKEVERLSLGLSEWIGRAKTGRYRGETGPSDDEILLMEDVWRLLRTLQ